MKFKTTDNTPSGAPLTNTLALFSFLATVLASPISTPDAPNSLASKSGCVLGKCGLAGKCFKEGSCFGVNIFDPDWSHCSICSCPGRGFGGRTDPTCVMDTDCLNVQLGNTPDPCGHKGHQYGGREASANPAPQRDGGIIDKYATKPNIKAPANIPESIPFTSYLRSRSTIEAEALEKLRDAKPESHVLNERDELMKEYARLIDDGPGGPVIPDAAMMERLRSITHPGKRACYTVENGAIVGSSCGTVENNIEAAVNPMAEGDPRDPLAAVAEGDPRDPLAAVEKRACYTVKNGAIVSSACGTVENNTDIDGDVDANVDVDVKKRGGCFTAENGVIVEKRGGCGSVGPDVEGDPQDSLTAVAEGDPREPLAAVAEGDPRDPLATVEKRVGCFVKENGIVYAQPNCDDPNRGTGPPFPVAEGDPRDPLAAVAEGDPRDPLAAVAEGDPRDE